MKSQRQEAIKEIIRRRSVRTQEQILQELQKMGIATTQATISRDLDELGVEKVSGGGYAFVQAESSQRAKESLKRMAEFVRAVDYSENLVLVKTPPGGAPGVASVLDQINWPEIIGTVAGDDTILVVTAAKRLGKRVAQKLKKMVK